MDDDVVRVRGEYTLSHQFTIRVGTSTKTINGAKFEEDFIVQAPAVQVTVGGETRDVQMPDRIGPVSEVHVTTDEQSFEVIVTSPDPDWMRFWILFDNENGRTSVQHIVQNGIPYPPVTSDVVPDDGGIIGVVYPDGHQGVNSVPAAWSTRFDGVIQPDGTSVAYRIATVSQDTSGNFGEIQFTYVSSIDTQAPTVSAHIVTMDRVTGTVRVTVHDAINTDVYVQFALVGDPVTDPVLKHIPQSATVKTVDVTQDGLLPRESLLGTRCCRRRTWSANRVSVTL